MPEQPESVAGLVLNLVVVPAHGSAPVAPAEVTQRDRFLTPDGRVPALASIERDLIAFAIDRYNGHMSEVARSLGIGRSTLYRKLREYDLEPGAENRDAA